MVAPEDVRTMVAMLETGKPYSESRLYMWYAEIAWRNERVPSHPATFREELKKLGFAWGSRENRRVCWMEIRIPMEGS
jgi:hypothetical protein